MDTTQNQPTSAGPGEPIYDHTSAANAIEGIYDVPADPAHYQIKLSAPVEYEERVETDKALRTIGKSIGASQSDISVIAYLVDQVNARARGFNLEELDAAKTTTGLALQREWGVDFDHNLGAAKDLVRRADPALRQMLLETGLGNHPAMVRHIASIALRKQGSRK